MCIHMVKSEAVRGEHLQCTRLALRFKHIANCLLDNPALQNHVGRAQVSARQMHAQMDIQVRLQIHVQG